MFASGFVTLFFVALVGVNVVGYPVPERALAEHRTLPLQAYINRDYVRLCLPWLHQSQLINISLRLTVELSSARLKGCNCAYAKRQIQDLGEIPVKAPQGVTVPYAKRQIQDWGNSVKAPQGVTVHMPATDQDLGKSGQSSQGVTGHMSSDRFKTWGNSGQSSQGVTVPYAKRQIQDLGEIPVKAPRV
ncbi:hypothetical protein BGY98DRAFT_1174919 [Russula aff. rugulosa BPL654]|nr:hypothetical protein BGY98DRAFT_1174919 [Russula aff. rugulosa BPL654]